MTTPVKTPETDKTTKVPPRAAQPAPERDQDSEPPRTAVPPDELEEDKWQRDEGC